MKTLPYGGVSHIGFSIIKAKLKPVVTAFASIGELDPWDTLHANWINGVAEDQQKVIAKSLIHLGLTPGSAPVMAAALGIDSALLTDAATNIQNGTPPTTQNTNALNHFDTMVSAILDAGYEEADQKYRNWAKLSAALIAVILAVFAAILLDFSPWLGLLIGLVSTPLAPVVKDLTSSLQAAANAVNTVKNV